MKTETKIAEERIDEIKLFEKDGKRDVEGRAEAIGIKQSCQRFLEFLLFLDNNYDVPHVILQDIKRKITDLKNAIKKYDEAGI